MVRETQTHHIHIRMRVRLIIRKSRSVWPNSRCRQADAAGGPHTLSTTSPFLLTWLDKYFIAISRAIPAIWWAGVHAVLRDRMITRNVYIKNY